MNQMQIRGLLVNFISPNACFKKIISRFLFETLSAFLNLKFLNLRTDLFSSSFSIFLVSVVCNSTHFVTVIVAFTVY